MVNLWSFSQAALLAMMASSYLGVLTNLAKVNDSSAVLFARPSLPRQHIVHIVYIVLNCNEAENSRCINILAGWKKYEGW
jgi:hypothetical protein